MTNQNMHLIVIWPLAVKYHLNILNYLNSADANVLCSIKITPTQVAVNNFLQLIYSNCKFDLERLAEKKNNILRDVINTGLILVLFEIDSGPSKWSPDRMNNVYPKILNLKDCIRNELQILANIDSSYETIHMTDNYLELSNDLPAAIQLICETGHSIFYNGADFKIV